MFFLNELFNILKMNNETIIESQVLAYNEKRFEDFFSFYSDEIKIYNLSQELPSICGKKDFVKIYTETFIMNRNLHCKITNRKVYSDFVVDEEWITGFDKYPDGLETCAIYQLKDFKIIKVWFLP